MDELTRAFGILDNTKDAWEYTDDGDIWAINYDEAARELSYEGIKNIDDVLCYIADYYVVDIC